MAVVDTGDFQAYLAGNKTKEEIETLFKLDLNYNIEMSELNIGHFYSRLELLGWVIGNHFNESNNENKKFIFQLTLDYLIYYYNLVKIEENEDVESIGQHITQHITNVLNCINVLIVRLYYRLKYYDLTDMRFDEFKNAVVSMEGRNEVVTDESISSGNLDDVVSTTREEIHNMIRFLQEGNTQIVLQRLQSIVNTPTPSRQETLPPVEKVKETISVRQAIEIYNKQYKPYTPGETKTQDQDDTDDNDIDINEVSEEEAILSVMSNYYKIVPDEELEQQSIDTVKNQEPGEIVVDENTNTESPKEEIVVDEVSQETSTEEPAEVVNNEVTAEELANQLFDSSWNINTITKIENYINGLNSIMTSYEEINDENIGDIRDIITAQKIYIGYILTFLKSQDMI